jgi:DNA-binding transcriptional MerR regulator
MMNSAQTNASQKFVTLKEAADKLQVSIDTLLSWNHHNILKPTITQSGEIGYTQEQIDQFLTIRKLTMEAKPAEAKPIAQAQPAHPQAPLTAPVPASITHDYAFMKSHGFQQITPRRSKFPSRLGVSFAVGTLVLSLAVLSLRQGFTFPSGTKQTQGIAYNNESAPSTQTSTMKLPGQTIATRVSWNDEGAVEKTLQNIGELIFKEKLVAPALYATTSNKTADDKQIMAVVTPKQKINRAGTDIQVNEEAVTNSYASTVAFEAPTDETSAIDARGNIKGEATIDTLTMLMGDIEDMVGSNSFKHANNDTTNQLVILVLSALGIFFVFQKQFAYAGKKSHSTNEPYAMPAVLPTQKILEVDQKTDGTVVLLFLGKEHKISKPEMNSESDQFIERLMTLSQPNTKEFEYDYDILTNEKGRFATPLSRLVTRLGFVGVKRDMFFPRTAKNSVLFRRYLTRDDLTDMNLTIEQILKELTLPN